MSLDEVRKAIKVSRGGPVAVINDIERTIVKTLENRYPQFKGKIIKVDYDDENNNNNALPPKDSYFCHMLTFGNNNRRRHVTVTEVEMALMYDYELVGEQQTKKVGDIVIYTKYGYLTHSGIVTKVDSQGKNVIQVRSKWGDWGEYLHPPAAVPRGEVIRYRQLFMRLPDYYGNYTIWRKKEKKSS